MLQFSRLNCTLTDLHTLCNVYTNTYMTYILYTFIQTHLIPFQKFQLKARIEYTWYNSIHFKWNALNQKVSSFEYVQIGNLFYQPNGLVLTQNYIFINIQWTFNESQCVCVCVHVTFFINSIWIRIFNASMHNI